MNYQSHYDKLIARGQRTLIHGYRERHHIIPKCLGGDNKEDNLVWLTPEEHYVAHQLLVKIYPKNHRLLCAAKMMTIGNNRNNKLYGWLRQQFAESMSKNHKGGVQKGYKQTEEHKANNRKPKSESARINMKGRIITEESRLRYCKAAKKRGNNGGAANWTEEIHKKASESQKAAWVIRKEKNGK